MDNKLESVLDIMNENQLQMIIISDGYNMHSLSGYKGHTGCILYFKDKQYILTDSRYTEQATIEAPQPMCIDIGSDGYSKTIVSLMKPYVEQMNASHNQEPSAFLIGFENEHISYNQFMSFHDTFREAFGDCIQFHELKNQINKLRVIKSEDELVRLSKAEEIGDLAFSHILQFIKPGKTPAPHCDEGDDKNGERTACAAHAVRRSADGCHGEDDERGRLKGVGYRYRHGRSCHGFGERACLF